ncbi:MAG: hydantoinase/oxoprolinase family protein [Candidatus Sumerlaeia bacterium]|nr:hydantoinase/oxoprolinase family protein [Candidatus Sumerlaeia bacterium]
MTEATATKRRIKIGIDVGGTFTHAVAVNLETMDLVGKSVVPTTHHAEEGVARGVVESMFKLLEEAHIATDEVVLIAHSTTQATNALIEGDVAKVGIIGMGTGPGAIRARREANLGKIELSPGKFLETSFRFLDTGGELTEGAIRNAIEELRAEGAETIVSSESFGVDDPRREERVAEIARSMGLPASSSSALSQLYGLRVRTRTAVINASMLPKMLETANRTEEAVRKSGIKAPLMVMRSDGGIMDIEAMRQRPILTMLSGPAAGVAAALMYERITDGCMVEVGGTTSDICVIKNGRPIVTHGEIGGHRLFVKTLDVRTVGIAGGSVPRATKSKLVEVGPRSAHIAKLGYDAFTPNITSVEPVLIQPRKGDPSDYLALRINGEEKPSITLTPTGASNILGLTSDYAKGDAESIEKCFEAVAKWMGTTPKKLATQLLDLCVKKVGPVVKAMLVEHKLTKKKITFVGGGGGAEAIVPYTAKKLGLPHRIAKNTEVISAIGVALGIIQDTVEKTIMNPSESDLINIRKEAFDSVLRMGADSNSIQVVVEIDRQTKRVTATAQGTPELRTRSLGGELPDNKKLKQIAADTMSLPEASVQIMSDDSSWIQVFTAEREKPILFGLFKTVLTPIVIVDREGITRLQLEDALYNQVKASAMEETLQKVITDYTLFGDAGMVLPDVYLIKPGQIVDLTGLVEASQMVSVARVETQSMLPTDTVGIISMRKTG